LIPQTATFTRSLAPMIFPEDLVPLIAKEAKTEDCARNFLRVSIMSCIGYLIILGNFVLLTKNPIQAVCLCKEKYLWV
jgi:hypothetical protein